MTDLSKQALFEPVAGPAPKSFIEVQFPVSKLSKESYKERKAKNNQTLTGLGKWWGRKPLVLVRAIVLGLLVPATSDPEKDREIFLSLMTMDEEGLEGRLRKSIPASVVADLLSPSAAGDAVSRDGARVTWRHGLTREQRRQYQLRAFRAMSYDRKMDYCLRPEEVDGPSQAAWGRINAHLDSSATSLPELVRELGERRWGQMPKVGDAFCGGGSIPFEAARIGCDVYASDINPVAGLLTWGALNIVGGGEEVVERVKLAQRSVYDAACKQIDAWGIERNEQGWIADAYLYCNEVIDPTTGWKVPLASSWAIARQSASVVARLIPDPINKQFAIEITENATSSELNQASLEGTSVGGVRCPVDRDGNWLQPNQRQITSIEQLRGPHGLRLWTNEDIESRQGDVYQERLYCIRWVDPETSAWHYRSPDVEDLGREQHVLQLLRERFADWQAKGYIPSREIEPGDETSRLMRERGWTHWHHLFNPRQLLFGGLIAENSSDYSEESVQSALLLSTAKIANLNSRLCGWNPARDSPTHTFYNQALNTLDNYGCKPSTKLSSAVFDSLRLHTNVANVQLEVGDAREINDNSSLWITDPGYGDMIMYDELSEFFLAWQEKRLSHLFPDWYSDSHRALNIKGQGEPFRLGLTGAYANLTVHMDDDGYQVVMFTHQDSSVWADVGLTLWAAGLQVSAAWTVATETPTSGVKGGGNYVQGTVCLVLRKRTNSVPGYLSDIHPEIQQEVRRQIQAMTALEDQEDPNFGDADYQLAAYAAALRVLTSYSTIDEIDIDRELRRPRERGVVSPITRLIEQAVRIASDEITPKGIEKQTWRRLTPEERLYLKGIETEASGEGREGVYQELARSYGAGTHRQLYASTSANAVRFKTPSEFARRDLGTFGEAEFDGSLLRRLLYAAYQTATSDDRDPRNARVSLRTDIPDYWAHRQHMIALLHFLIRHGQTLPHWSNDIEAMRLLQASLEHDAV